MTATISPYTSSPGDWDLPRSDSPTSSLLSDFSTCADERYEQAMKQIAQLESELSEFQISSRELESELEKELIISENQYGTMEAKWKNAIEERDSWKNKYIESQQEVAQSELSKQLEIKKLKEALSLAKQQLRDVEITNDDLEQHERIANSTLNDVEDKYNSTLEELAMLESELITKNQKIENFTDTIQRLKDDLRDVNEELDITKNKLQKSEDERLKYIDEFSKKRINNGTDKKIDTLPKKLSPAGIQSPLRIVTSGSNNEPDDLKSVKSQPSISSQNELPEPRVIKRMPTTNSMITLHGIIAQARDIEVRMGTIRSSLAQENKLKTHRRRLSPEHVFKALGRTPKKVPSTAGVAQLDNESSSNSIHSTTKNQFIFSSSSTGSPIYNPNNRRHTLRPTHYAQISDSMNYSEPRTPRPLSLSSSVSSTSVSTTTSERKGPLFVLDEFNATGSLGKSRQIPTRSFSQHGHSQSLVSKPASELGLTEFSNSSVESFFRKRTKSTPRRRSRSFLSTHSFLNLHSNSSTTNVSRSSSRSRSRSHSKSNVSASYESTSTNTSYSGYTSARTSPETPKASEDSLISKFEVTLKLQPRSQPQSKSAFSFSSLFSKHHNGT